MTNALTPVDAASMALAAAETTDDFVAVRTAATAAKAWVKARGLGIDEENKATTVILRAERGAGTELIRMAEAGERAIGGTFAGKPEGNGPHQPALRQSVETLESLGIPRQAAQDWQRAARIPEDQFEDMIRLSIESGTRLAKVNFYRGEPKPKNENLPTKEDGGFMLLREGAYTLLGWRVNEDGIGAPTKNGLLMLPLDELTTVAGIIKHLYEAYNEARAAR